MWHGANGRLRKTFDRNHTHMTSTLTLGNVRTKDTGYFTCNVYSALHYEWYRQKQYVYVYSMLFYSFCVSFNRQLINQQVNIRWCRFRHHRRQAPSRVQFETRRFYSNSLQAHPSKRHFPSDPQFSNHCKGLRMGTLRCNKIKNL